MKDGKKRPVQIRDGVVVDPNIEHHPPEGDVPPKRCRGHVRMPADSCPGYAKAKTKEQFMELARRGDPWRKGDPKNDDEDEGMMIGAYI